jgi:hypothetical protein
MVAEPSVVAEPGVVAWPGVVDFRCYHDGLCTRSRPPGTRSRPAGRAIPVEIESVCGNRCVGSG